MTHVWAGLTRGVCSLLCLIDEKQMAVKDALDHPRSLTDARWPYGSIRVVGGRAALRAWVGLGLAQEYAPRGGGGVLRPDYNHSGN